MQANQVVVAGFERPSNFPAKTSDSGESGAESGALGTASAILADPDLAWIVAEWANLPPAVKLEIITLATRG